MKATGGCLCGQVRYEIDGEPAYQGLCHCRDCQKATGSAQLPVLGMPAAAVRITGETRTYGMTGDTGAQIIRRFCPTCGSLISAEPEVRPGMIHLAAGTLDDPSAYAPDFAIYVGRRPAWARPARALTEHQGAPRRG